MKCKRFLNIIIFIYCCAYCMTAYAFNDKKTHPELTEAAIAKSNLDGYLITNIGFSKGYVTVFKGVDRKGYEQNYPISKWLQEGSTDEDALNICRASNHFHNPIRTGDWLTSQMSDSVTVDLVCGTAKRYSAVTWATGFKSPTEYIGARTGRYLGWTGWSDAPQNMGWDDARVYFYSALTLSDPVAREAQFVRTFKALGQVTHLLQDMAVPAHTRNDMQSHLFNALWPGNWSNPFEKYVVIDNSGINNNPVKPEFTLPIRHTDFWDKNIYNGANPSDGKNQGLAEYSNANFFSQETISSNTVVSANHQFPFPKLTDSSYICTDYLPGSSDKTKYISRRPCPTNGAPVDHLVALSMLTPKFTGLGLPSIPSLKSFVIDNNVHDTYAQEILPRAVGYSASLLDYFFRGTIEVKPVVGGVTATTLKVTARNTTGNGDAMTGGTLDLVIRYRQVDESSQQLNIFPLTDYQYMDIKLPGSNYTIDSTAKEFTFDLSASPVPSWAKDVTAFLVYHGQLGNEADSVAVGQMVLEGHPRKMTLSLPSVGVYGKTDGSTGFSQITVAATSHIPGLDLADGLIELVMIHRTSDSDPFQGARVTTSPADPLKYRYIRASEQTGKRTLVQGVKTELTFDISDNPVPIWASDVYMYISYKKAGDPDSMTRAVGFLDISEPTPIDVFNNADKICMNNQWYDAGSSAAIALVDTNKNGVAEEVDVYANNITNIFCKASPIVTSTQASDTDYTLNSPNKLLGGSSRRLGYILTDYNFNSSFMQGWVDGPSFWGEWTTTESNTGTAVKHQTDPDGSFTYPGMQTIRGNKIWWGAGLIYDNQNYPFDSPDCSWDAL